jgi:transcriptional regulator with XRE-family HTH domain
MSSLNASKVSSGIGYLDELINCFTIGDNVIWQVETGAFVELFCRAFIRESVKEKKDVIYISFNNSPKNILARIGSVVNNENVVIVDCFTAGKGENSGIFRDLYRTTYPGYKCGVIPVEQPGDAANFVKIINQIEETKPRGARYVLDSITGMQDLWGSSDQIMKFFTRQCPRLYELDTIAYWILERNAHSEQFRAQLSHITQDVIDLSVENGVCNMAVIKAENHPERGMLRKHCYEVVDGTIRFIEESEPGTVNLGRKIKELRQKMEISQAQLAKAAGVTPSTVSQVESNAISLSLQALLRTAKALNVSIGELFEEELPQKTAPFVYRLKNRKKNVMKVQGVILDAIVPEEDQGGRANVDMVSIGPGAEIGSHFITKKGVEIGYLLSGSVELEMKRRAYTVSEGDVVCFSSEVPSRWKNNSEKPAKLLWVVVR